MFGTKSENNVLRCFISAPLLCLSPRVGLRVMIVNNTSFKSSFFPLSRVRSKDSEYLNAFPLLLHEVL